MRLPAAAIGIQTDRGADPTHVHGKQGGHATTCVCSFPARSTRNQTSRDACLCPQMLRDYANLGSDIVVIGVGTRAEIWNRQAWEDYLADKEQGYSDIADDVLPAMEF